MLDSKSIESLLVVAPHADDEVLGAGGLMAQASRNGAKVHVIFMAVDGLKDRGHPLATNPDEPLPELEAGPPRAGSTPALTPSGTPGHGPPISGPQFPAPPAPPPPQSRHSLKISWLASSTRLISSGCRSSNSKIGCRFPSPA